MKKTQRHPSSSHRNSRQVRGGRKLKRKKRMTIFYFTSLLLLIILLGIFALSLFHRSHFRNGTTIDGVDCSWLTTQEAYSKLNEQLKEKEVSFIFVDAKYYFRGDSFGLTIPSTTELESFLAMQKSQQKRYFSSSQFTLDEGKLKDILKSIPNLDSTKMIPSQDASIVIEDDLLTLVPEVTGNYIDFDEAYHLASSSFRSGYTSVDFSNITDNKANVTSYDLQETVTSINQVLETSISFVLNDDSILTLDKSIMKDWIVVDADGHYGIDIDGNLPLFISKLSEQCANSTTWFEFTGTNAEPVMVPAKNLLLDENAEMERIKSELGSATSYTHTPIFSAPVGDSYVEVDISRQHIWMYVGGKCVVDSDCVTGNAGIHDTPEGYFFLTYKTTNAVLRGYNDNGSKYASPVSYWMPFNGGIGLHDASWRDSFGGSIYLGNGSHGCVNLPKETAKKIYQNIDKTMPIIVYSSN